MSEVKPERCTSCGQKFLHLKCMLKDGVCIACWQSKAIAADELAEAVEATSGRFSRTIPRPDDEPLIDFCIDCCLHDGEHDTDCSILVLRTALAAYRKARGKA